MIEETLNAETSSRVYISSGTIVSDLKDVSRSYKEAKMALEVGKILKRKNLLSIMKSWASAG